MARVTVEDCAKVIPDRFELVVLASRRARDISSGAEIKVERDNDRDAVVALREIADGAVSKKYLEEEVVASYQTIQKYDEPSLEGSSQSSSDDENVVSQIDKNKVFSGDNIEIDD